MLMWVAVTSIVAGVVLLAAIGLLAVHPSPWWSTLVARRLAQRRPR